jgi:hypothetical protein
VPFPFNNPVTDVINSLVATQEVPFHFHIVLLAEYVSFNAGDAGKFNAAIIYYS